MTNHGDDCYFFYYSNCAKGDSCPFRHCEAAMGSEVVCNLWQESRCFRQVCKFRHMEIKKNRKEIACYWENQPAGCQKPHCAFHHEKPRFIDGQYVPPNKSSALKQEEEPHEDPLPPAPAPIPSPANPQLRGVIKAETQENVPSPTHPPVVINPADDEDEDEDDQFSEGEDSRSGSDGSRLVSPRKMTVGSSSDDSLNFGVRTLEEIRLRKALKASMRRAGYSVPGQGSDQRNNGASGEKENVRSFIRPSLFTAKDEMLEFGDEIGKRNVTDRLGKRIVKEVPAAGDLPMKRCLAERLGRKVDVHETDLPSQIALKPVRDRLGLPVEPAANSESAESNSETKAPEVIRIKTLDEIRQEKLNKSLGHTQGQGDEHHLSVPDTSNSASTKDTRRCAAGKPTVGLHIKTFSEVLHAKRKLDEDQQQGPSLRKAKQPAVEVAPGNTQLQGSSGTAVPSRVAPPGGEVKVKTLDEIRKEKAARMQAVGKEASNGKSPGSATSSGEGSVKKSRVLRINKPASPATSSSTQKTTDLTENTEKPVEPAAVSAEASPANGSGDAASVASVKVKTFEEIMREKRLRRQQLQEVRASSAGQVQGTAKAESTEKPAAGQPAQKKRVLVSPPTTSSPPSPATVTTEAPGQTPMTPLHQRVVLKTKAASPVSPQPGSPLRQAEAESPSLSSSAAPGKRKSGSAVGSSPPGRAAPAAASVSPRPSVEGAPVEKSPDGGPKSPGQATEAKVRPKLNVRPSVMKPGQKRKSANRSAVAAVKPLNSVSAALQDRPQEEPLCKRREVSSPSGVSVQMMSVVPRCPPADLQGPGTNSSPLKEEIQAVPDNTPSPAITTASQETCVVPQSPKVKTPTQSKPRRPSVVMPRSASTAPSASSSTSAMDEFDELMNEFTDDRLEDDLELDPGKGEDDLLLELSEMIDS
ncbi:zinc finger CCCH domain-containing protein 11A [Esox lucius]|uniref:C3H1-type domain-containing protein n=1 Tax=Esox lucius TaxID=8010 RepID=A0A3P8ZDW4_ESOLU|nr:zinc finger CCCH domain-containing protein 11A [Esox lucius]XP_010879404.2 zinc finger CCCH domain-containing protein 11A [Esox lucius]XP_010879405.2 zinc finger CCCH domain-containing protein 11A [Esox lucius]